MKRIFTVFMLAACVAVSAWAITVNDVAGLFNGNLIVGGQPYNGKDVYILPGTQANTITFVLPDFKFNNASLGDIVLTNIPMDASGKLTLENSSLYIRAISERATIDILNGIKEGNTTYNSIISATSAQVLLSIAASSLPEPIMVLFNGNRVTNKNYAINNGGFEGNWSDNEPGGWHSFGTATGNFASMAGGDSQFKQSTDKRPGSTGSHSVMIASNLIVGVKANGNCTNGCVNAGSMTANDPEGNYNYSDPSKSGFNTPFVGNPDSIVFWAKYIPADKDPNNSVNKARMRAVVTTNTRYQDPESGDYGKARIADATLNYTAKNMDWQRLAVPFTYSNVNPASAAYVLITFSTNMTPGGGSTYSEGSVFNKTYHYDNIYLDDVEMVYNHALTSLKMNGADVSFSNGQATTQNMFSDQDYTFAATSNGKASKSFIGYDAENNQVHVYVVAQNYSQARAYSVYTLQMAEPIYDTEYAYSATTCANEPYSDNMFSNLTEAGTYNTTIPNTRGGDSIITLTLNVLPTYSIPTTATIKMNETYSWQGRQYANLVPGLHRDSVTLKTQAGCDSLRTLALTVEAIDYSFSETITACQHEAATWHNQVLPTAKAGEFVIYDSHKSIYGKDSVYTLTLTVLPTYQYNETKYVNEADLVWRGQAIQGLPQSNDPYFFYDSLTTIHGCDSVYVLTLHVSDIPVTYGYYQLETCQGEEVCYEGTCYGEAFSGEVRISPKNIYGGDSIINLTVTILPTYEIAQDLTIREGDDAEWEYYNLSYFTPGNYTLEATYYTENDCDSTMVLNLTVRGEDISTGLSNTRDSKQVARKVLYNGKLYFIRKDESIYDVLGNRIQ
ncbi:MAG: calycin-like domain-containing protein [Paludibacteraceae bacterium]|nr:calycin-like domain-containing protein [Paludibacteraceae bacterium]